MKPLLHFVLLFTFLGNLIATSAMADACMSMGGNAPAQQEQIESDMPCHNNEEQQSVSATHCEGSCTCIHASLNPSPVLENHFSLIVPLAKTDKFKPLDEQAPSVSISPPYRPPISHS